MHTHIYALLTQLETLTLTTKLTEYFEKVIDQGCIIKRHVYM